MSAPFILKNIGFRPFVAPWWRSLVGSALASGARAWRLRTSRRSFSGAVVVVGFDSEAAAREFAAGWSEWCGVPLALRAGQRVPWAVSVPVAPPSVASASLSRPAPVLGGFGARAWVGSPSGVL